MSTFNTGKYIRQAIDSIVNQTYQDFELIIVDDGSTDNTRHIVNKYCAQHPQKIQYIYQDNAGSSKARNVGIKASRGEYIAILDSDDISLPQRLQKQVEFLDQNPDIALLGTGGWIINEQNQILTTFKILTDSQMIKKQLIRRNQFIHSSVMFRKICMEKYGFYREELAYSQDYELYLRLSAHYNFANLADLLCKWRLSLSSISIKRKVAQDQSVKTLQKLARENRLNHIETIQIDYDLSRFLFLAKCFAKASSYFHWAQRLYDYGDYRNSLKLTLLSILHKPINISIWRFLFVKYLMNPRLMFKPVN